MTDNWDDRDDEISLLDLAVAVAENWLLIVLVPIAAGLIAYFVLSVGTPRQFQSEALLRLSEQEAVMLRSDRVLNTPKLNEALARDYGGAMSNARASFLGNRFDITKLPDAELFQIRLRADTPDDAHQLLEAIIGSLMENSVPTDLELQRMELRRSQAETSLAELEAGLARLNRLADNSLALDRTSADIALGELGQSIVSILGNIETRRTELFNLEQALLGSVMPDDIIQPPTLSDAPNNRGLLMPVLLTVLGTGFVMLIVAFIRTGLRNARSKETVEKINRIRRAFWLKPVEDKSL